MTRTEDIQAKVIAMIARDGFGLDATFRVVSSSVYDPATGETTETASTVVVRTSVPVYPKTNPRSADTALRGDATIYVPARDLTFTPQIGQSVTIAAEPWSILDLTSHRMEGGIVVYECQLRRGAVATEAVPV